MVLSSVKAVAHQGRKAKAVNPRLSAALILKDVLGGRSLSDAISTMLLNYANPRDRALAQELSYGVMRWHPRLTWLLRQLVDRPLKSKDRDVEALLLIGLYQLLYLRVADHAAVHETAGAAKGLRKRWAVGLINGVLREFQRRRQSLLEAADANPEAASAMPHWLLERIRQRWPEQWRERVAAMVERPPMSLRVNRRRMQRDDYLSLLQRQGVTALPIHATQSGVMLDKPLDVGSVPGFSEGLVSVQDGGAQLAAELLDILPGHSVLDACAAPGGKTGHILESAEDLQLTALDVDAERLLKVHENLKRLQLHAEILQGDAAHPGGVWANRQYDRILLDVPCSASGIIRRHPDIKYLRRPEDIAALADQQGRILKAVWSLLKPGGKLLYVTCSILPEENEQRISAFLAVEPSVRELPLSRSWGETCEVGRQIVPGMQNMDGFYYALMQKVLT
ncbi:MAG: 16S rRNA (cytosine(967)-C(5))-methyltransferase RsmB [Gammaproteobacteria bacterium]|nr:16S rRNA (cytosine(967)-C(5))-methyltransferase RsmB [Gammaproteobacteria bacterium]